MLGNGLLYLLNMQTIPNSRIESLQKAVEFLKRVCTAYVILGSCICDCGDLQGSYNRSGTTSDEEITAMHKLSIQTTMI
jgi:hypothetical protein